MSVLRVVALGAGWIVMLVGSLASLVAAVMAGGVTTHAAFAPGWTLTLIVAASGIALMISGLPMMFFGCEANRPGKTTGFAPSPAYFPLDVQIPVQARQRAMAPSHLSGYAVNSLVGAH